MFEQDWPSDRIDEYWQRFADLVTPSGAVLIDLRHPDTEWFLRNHTVEVRADVWEKISTHVRSTPVGRRMETEGADTPVEFWIRYRAVCDRLAGLGLIHRLELDLADGWPMTAEDLIAAVDAA